MSAEREGLREMIVMQMRTTAWEAQVAMTEIEEAAALEAGADRILTLIDTERDERDERERLRELVHAMRHEFSMAAMFRMEPDEAGMADRILALIDTDRDDCPTCRRLIEATMAEMERDADGDFANHPGRIATWEDDDHE
jgi:hypothetical protein